MIRASDRNPESHEFELTKVRVGPEYLFRLARHRPQQIAEAILARDQQGAVGFRRVGIGHFRQRAIDLINRAALRAERLLINIDFRRRAIVVTRNLTRLDLINISARRRGKAGQRESKKKDGCESHAGILEGEWLMGSYQVFVSAKEIIQARGEKDHSQAWCALFSLRLL